MPGYILHLTVAEMALNVMKEMGTVIDEKKANAFRVGNLLPDAVTDKNASHFRNPKYRKVMVEYPDMEMFLDKYRSFSSLGDMSWLGYYFHLYIDRVFFTEYLPQVVTFLDKEGNSVNNRDIIVSVLIKRTGEKVLKEEFFSDEYYYGDYTRMNTYLAERYHLNFGLDTNIENPGIEEVNYQDTKRVLGELRGYLDVPADEVKNLRIYEVEHLLQFLEKATEEFFEKDRMC